MKNKIRKLIATLCGAGLLVAGVMPAQALAAKKEQESKKAAPAKKPAAKSVAAKPAKPAKPAKVATPVKPSKPVTQARADKAAPARQAVAPKPRETAKARPRVERHVAVETLSSGNPNLQSSAFLVADQNTGEVILEKNSETVVPIASITKLMTAMVVLDANLNLKETLTIGQEDVDTLRGSRSRLPVGTELQRDEMIHLALMSSENRAAASLARHYPGGKPAFVAAMNRKAQALGLRDTRFFDSTGLNAGNVSSARDLARMVAAAGRYPLIREFSTDDEQDMIVKGRTVRFANTNGLVKSHDWHINVSKTGYINESGKCLVMQAQVNNRPTVIVLLDSWGKYTRVADAQRVKRWMEAHLAHRGGSQQKTAQHGAPSRG